jgi:hypothetical protein
MNPSELRIQLTSGTSLTVLEVFLCLEEPLRRSDALRLKAAEGLKGVSTGIGFWGSPGWAIGGAIGLRLIEGFVSNSIAKAALHDLQEAARLASEAMQEGLFIPVAEVDGVALPQPSLWRGLLRQADGAYRAYTHDGQGFIRVNTRESGVLCVLLDKIETYAVPATQDTPEEAIAKRLGVSFNGQQYEYGGYRYDRLSDAIAYAQAQRAKA